MGFSLDRESAIGLLSVQLEVESSNVVLSGWTYELPQSAALLQIDNSSFIYDNVTTRDPYIRRAVSPLNLEYHFSIFMAASFSTSGEDAIQKTIDVQPETSTLSLSPHQFEDFYEIGRTAEEIVRGNYSRVRYLFHINMV